MVGMMGIVCSTAGRCRNRGQTRSRQGAEEEANTLLEASKTQLYASMLPIFRPLKAFGTCQEIGPRLESSRSCLELCY